QEAGCAPGRVRVMGLLNRGHFLVHALVRKTTVHSPPDTFYPAAHRARSYSRFLWPFRRNAVLSFAGLSGARSLAGSAPEMRPRKPGFDCNRCFGVDGGSVGASLDITVGRPPNLRAPGR